MKVTIVGVGRVGSNAAFSIAQKGICDEIALIDTNLDRVRGEALDLRHGVSSLPTDVEVNGSDDYLLSADSDLVVVTAGIPRKPGETRADLAVKNAGLFKDIVTDVVKYNKRSFLFMVSNPVDVATLTALKYSRYPKKKVFGLGTMLDTIRLESLIAAAFNESIRSVYTPILGEHGETMFPVFSNSYIKDIPIRDYPGAQVKLLNGIFKNARSGGAMVIKMKGGTCFAPALAIAEVVECITENKDRILPLSVYSEKDKLCISQLVRVNRRGVAPIDIDLDETETKRMKKSVAALRKMNRAVGLM